MVDDSSGWFSAARYKPFPSQFSEFKTPVTVDVLLLGWIVSFCCFAASVYLIIPGQPKKLLIFVRVTVALLLGLCIMICNFGHQWEVGHLRTHTPYRAGTGDEIDADIGVWMGLRGVNITLKATPPTEGVLANETINYNERFSWTWSQGRAGFGPMAGQIQRDFREAQRKGLPLPILWIAEYFTFDGEGLRFGRHYRLAGWYAHICLWAALPTWFLSLVLFNMVIRYGAYMVILTGALMTTSATIWATVRNSYEMVVPFTPPEGILTTDFGTHWFLALLVGIVCMIYGIVVLGFDHFYHEKTCAWFGLNPLAYEEYEVLTEEVTEEGENNQAGDIEMAPMDRKSHTLAQRAKGIRKSIAIRIKGRGTSSKNWKVQHIEEKAADLLPPPPPPLLVVPENDYELAADPSFLAFTDGPSHAPPPPPTNY